jgi:integrase
VKRLIKEYGDRKVKPISQEEMEAFAANISTLEYKVIDNQGKEKVKAISPATAGRCLTIAGAIFRAGQRWGYLNRNPAEFVRNPKASKAEIYFLEPDEIRRLIEATDPRHKCLIMFACLTGCRQSEILGLRWSDIDLMEGRAFVRQVLQGNQFFEPKTESSRRTVDLPEILVEELKQHQVRQAIELDQNAYDLVFTSREGTPMVSRNVTQRILEPALTRADLRKVSFHSLRHSYVSMLISQGENVKTIQALVGHASAKMTWDIYGHLF